MVVHCLIVFNHYKLNMSVEEYMNCKTQLRKKKTYKVHKIDEYNFVNIEFKYYIPIIVEEQYVSTSCQACAF